MPVGGYVTYDPPDPDTTFHFDIELVRYRYSVIIHFFSFTYCTLFVLLDPYHQYLAKIRDPANCNERIRSVYAFY